MGGMSRGEGAEAGIEEEVAAGFLAQQQIDGRVNRRQVLSKD